MNYKWTEEEVAYLKTDYPLYGAEHCASILSRTAQAVRNKAYKLKIPCSDIGASQRFNAWTKYAQWLKNSDYTCLESFATYKGTSYKILHKHNVCGFEWEVSPNNLRKLVGCPNCSSSGRKESPSVLYLVYFDSLGLYKIGVTVNWDKRKYDFGYKASIIELFHYTTGSLAYKAEKDLKSKLAPYMYNSGELKNGNTETFIWPH